MPIYEKCGPEVDRQIQDIIAKWHPDLYEAEVRISALFAYAPKDEQTNLPRGHAIVKRGIVRSGESRVVPIKNRVQGMADGEIVVDGDKWTDWPTATQTAVLDHLLYSFMVKRDRPKKKGTEAAGIVTDDHGRPVLKIRPHDVELGLFIEIAKRHGAAAIEIQQSVDLFTKHGQVLFPGMVPIGNQQGFLIGDAPAR